MFQSFLGEVHLGASRHPFKDVERGLIYAGEHSPCITLTAVILSLCSLRFHLPKS